MTLPAIHTYPDVQADWDVLADEAACSARTNASTLVIAVAARDKAQRRAHSHVEVDSRVFSSP